MYVCVFQIKFPFLKHFNLYYLFDKDKNPFIIIFVFFLLT